MDGQSNWNRRDPVHLTGAAYWNLAAVISDTALSVDPADSASASGYGAGQQRKRRAESVMTLLPVSSRKRLHGAAKLKVAGWLLGKAEPSLTVLRGRGSVWHEEALAQGERVTVVVESGRARSLEGEAGRRGESGSGTPAE
jgi:hypothetical protein